MTDSALLWGFAPFLLLAAMPWAAMLAIIAIRRLSGHTLAGLAVLLLMGGVFSLAGWAGVAILAGLAMFVGVLIAAA